MPSRFRYTPEMIDWLDTFRDDNKHLSWDVIVQLFNQKFKTTCTCDGLRYKYYHSGSRRLQREQKANVEYLTPYTLFPYESESTNTNGSMEKQVQVYGEPTPESVLQQIESTNTRVPGGNNNVDPGYLIQQPSSFDAQISMLQDTFCAQRSSFLLEDISKPPSTPRLLPTGIERKDDRHTDVDEDTPSDPELSPLNIGTLIWPSQIVAMHRRVESEASGAASSRGA
ncbi:MAG: hypothetical protein M1824_005953 [Vezdaea acicularis]|nr:MAG: hypothetical protein M1824_005953 [Vezdaea acicularis]